MKNDTPISDVVVAGHICLDMIPDMGSDQVSTSLEEILTPGKLVSVGPAKTATGGAVANTGLALHRLGLPSRCWG
jgi:sugar/nucleoside kinase (ribokinase family)